MAFEFDKYGGGAGDEYGRDPYRPPSQGGGFSDRPVPEPYRPPIPERGSRGAASGRGARKRPRRSRAGGGGIDIPWKLIICLTVLLAVIVCCVLFRAQITGFLTEILTWLIIVLVIVFIVKKMIFPNKKR